MTALCMRENLAERTAENWRPPQFKPPGGRLAAIAAGARRFFDLQAGSIWRDVAAELPSCRGVVLDVGCGAQPHRPLVHRDAEYIPIDTADAKDHFGYETPNTRYFSGDCWPVDDGSVDLVLCTEVLEHVLEPRRLLAEAKRCLRSGGRLLLTVPFAARWHFIPHDYWRYTPSSLKQLLRSAGFQSIAVYARGNAVTVACYKVMALLLPLLMPQAAATVGCDFLCEVASLCPAAGADHGRTGMHRPFVATPTRRRRLPRLHRRGRCSNVSGKALAAGEPPNRRLAPGRSLSQTGL